VAQDFDWVSDKKRYAMARPFLREQSIWAVWLYRYGRRIDKKTDTLSRKIQIAGYWLLFRLVETCTGISLPKQARIGPGLRIWHFGGIFIHPNAVIGANCTLRQGVTIGNRYEDDCAPILGDNVVLGAYAQVLGGIRIGDNCQIGALTVVLHDVPDNATAVGNPARIIFSDPARDLTLQSVQESL
jgi:serine O-acetyltransferase